MKLSELEKTFPIKQGPTDKAVVGMPIYPGINANMRLERSLDELMTEDKNAGMGVVVMYLNIPLTDGIHSFVERIKYGELYKDTRTITPAAQQFRKMVIDQMYTIVVKEVEFLGMKVRREYTIQEQKQ
jgi:hypothetical protein